MNDAEASWPARVLAANSLLDRAWGKPKQAVAVRDQGSTSMLRIEIVDPNGQTETVTINDRPSAPELVIDADAPDDKEATGASDA